MSEAERNKILKREYEPEASEIHVVKGTLVSFEQSLPTSLPKGWVNPNLTRAMEVLRSSGKSEFETWQRYRQQ